MRPLRLAFACSLFVASTSALACGGATVGDAKGSPPATAPDSGGLGVTPPSTYPSGMIAAYGPSGAGVSFFVYDTATGFVPLGGISSGPWQSTACEELAFDAKRNLYLTCSDSVLEFANGATEGAQPVRVINAPILASGLLVGSAVDSKGNVYVVVNGVGDDGGVGDSAIAVFGPDSDSAPIRVIQGENTQLFYPNNIAIDANDNVYVGTDDVPVVEFAAGATGNATPVQLIGTATCGGTEGVAVDSAGDVYIDCTFPGDTANGFGVYSVVEFAGGAAVRTIRGPATGMNELLTTAVDGAGRVFVGDYVGTDGGTGVYVFGPDASGDVAPEATLSTVSGLAVAVAP